jgi:hypothetical protein
MNSSDSNSKAIIVRNMLMINVNQSLNVAIDINDRYYEEREEKKNEKNDYVCEYVQ